MGKVTFRNVINFPWVGVAGGACGGRIAFREVINFEKSSTFLGGVWCAGPGTRGASPHLEGVLALKCDACALKHDLSHSPRCPRIAIIMVMDCGLGPPYSTRAGGQDDVS